MVMTSRRPPAGPVTERTEDLVRAFHENGFVHVPGLLSEQEVAQSRTAIMDAITVKGATRKVSESGLLGTLDGWENNDTLRGLALHPRIGAFAERLAGMPLRVWGGELAVKRPGDNRHTDLHDDLTFELLNARISLNAWVALVDVPEEGGCLTYFPGSHRREGPRRIDMTNRSMTDLECNDPATSYMFTQWPSLRWAPRMTVPVRAGGVTFHHHRTAHSASANDGQYDRIVFLVTFTDADATYQPLGKHDPLPYQPGQLLPDERYPRVEASERSRRSEPANLTHCPGCVTPPPPAATRT